MNLLVFDMDGVLVDVSGSYREATRQAAYTFLKDCKGGQLLPDPLFSLEELAAVKQSGGLNNDWDMTHRIISLLLVIADTCGDAGTAGKDRARWDVAPLAGYLRSTRRPLSAIMESGRLSKAADGFYTGDVGSGNIIKQIFQEIYLGQELFKETYGFCLRVYNTQNHFVDDDDLICAVRQDDNADRSGDITINPEWTIDEFEKKVMEIFGVKVQVYTPDDTKLADNDIKLFWGNKQ